jgi:four helix bundle protein
VRSKEQRAKERKAKAKKEQSMNNESKAQGGGDDRPHWRFQDLEIWQLAVELAVKFHKTSEQLDTRRLYRYAEQLRGAGLSLSNNIAEGSGSRHKQEFIQFLNISRRSLFEDASMLLVFEKLNLLETKKVDALLRDCDSLSRKITNFSRSLQP